MTDVSTHFLVSGTPFHITVAKGRIYNRGRMAGTTYKTDYLNFH